jgi:hypothetical protein
MGGHSYKTTRLGRGRHDGPGAVVCVMELASMLAHERFGDRPQSVCPVIGSLLRHYNDAICDRWRGDLYRYAAEAVGTRASDAVQRDRAAVALAFASSGYRRGVSLGRVRVMRGGMPTPEDGPDAIAEHVIGSLRRRHGVAAHRSILWLLDRLIAQRESAPVTAHLLERCREVEPPAELVLRASVGAQHA